MLSIKVCETIALEFHHSILFYFILFYFSSWWVFLVQTIFVSYFDFKQVFLWWIWMKKNKMNKGVLICLHHYVSFYFKFVCFPWRCVRNFTLMNAKTKLDSKIFKRKNLVLIFWNFLILCKNLKSCMYSSESQNIIWSTPTLLWATDFYWTSKNAHSPIVSFFTWLYRTRPVHKDIQLAV